MNPLAAPHGVRRFGVRPRLIVALIVPLAVLCVVTFGDVVDRRWDRVRAEELGAETESLLEFVEFASALFDEQLMSTPIEDDPNPAVLESVRSATDRAFEHVDGDSTPVGASDIEHVRRMVDSGRYDRSLLVDRYTQLRDEVDRQLRASMRSAQWRAVEIGNAEAVVAVELLGAVLDGARSSADQVAALADYWRAGDFEAAYSRSNLARTTERWENDADHIYTFIAGAPELATAWEGVISRAMPFTRAVDDALAGAVGGWDPMVLAAGAARTDAIVYVAPLVSTGIAQIEDEVAEATTAAVRRAVAVMAGSLALSSLAAWMAGRSIARPVERLTRAALEVGAGDLDVDALPLRGPHDLVSAASAFNDLVANLGLLEHKARALAAGRLDDGVLSEELPGRLGRVLDESVRVLSDSIVTREALQARLAHDATHDPLTGLLNRAGLNSVVERACPDAARRGTALVVVSLDDFKWVNDTWGHPIGDAALVEIANRLRLVAGEESEVARMGGDEFVIVAHDDGIGPGSSDRLAQRVLSSVSLPIRVEGCELVIAARVGIAELRVSDTPDRALRRADLAISASRRGGPGAVVTYDAELQREVDERAAMAEDLRASLRREGDLHLAFQPIIDAATGAVVAAETLLRWNRPGHGPVPPDVFIAVAESSRLILDVDRWVLQKALQVARTWTSGPLSGIRLSVNVSGRHLMHPDLVASVQTALTTSGFDPNRLVLEMTETVLVSDLARAQRQMARLRALGVRIAIDDFGTGYTSLSHLRALPVDFLKIDRGLVDELDPGDHDDIVGIVCRLARHLGLATVAEGVEQGPQALALAARGCTFLQGWAIAKAMATDEFVEWVEHNAEGFPQLAGLGV